MQVQPIILRHQNECLHECKKNNNRTRIEARREEAFILMHNNQQVVIFVHNLEQNLRSF